MDVRKPTRTMHPWTRCALAALFLILSCVATPSQTAMDKERREAAFLHNVLMFVQWNDPPPSAFEFCVEGNALLGFALSRELRNATIHGSKVKVRLVDRHADLKDCQALMFAEPDPRQMAKQLAALKGSTPVTFGNSDHFLEAGGVFQFTDDNGRLQLGVNLESARAAGIQIDARLLALAKHLVRTGKATGG
jgi:YfiR/HmsC-like